MQCAPANTKHRLSAADLENERLTEQASLAEYFFEIRGQDALQKILDDTVEADKKALDIAKTRYDTGVDDQISLVEAQTTLESAQSAAINIGIARAQYEHAIAMLVGKPALNVLYPGGSHRRAPLRQYPLEFRPNCSNGARISPPRSGTWPRPMRISGLLMQLIILI